MTRFIYCLAIAALTALVGCGTVVTINGDDATGDPSTEAPPQVQAFNIGAQVDDVMKVAIGNYTEVCGPSAFDHYPDNATPCTSVPSWRIRLNIPVAQLQVGNVMSLYDVGDGFEYSEIDPAVPYVPAYGCGGGGGSYAHGTVKIVALSDTMMTIRLQGTDLIYNATSGTADGDWDISLCGGTPEPPQLLHQAVATMASSTLVIVAANSPNTCANPHLYGVDCTSETDTVEIDLPPDRQTVGTYPLTNIANFSSRGTDSYGQCSGGAGTYWNGTIEITSIDSTSVSFKLSGTSQLFLAQGNADGSYVAPRCSP